MVNVQCSVFSDTQYGLLGYCLRCDGYAILSLIGVYLDEGTGASCLLSSSHSLGYVELRDITVGNAACGPRQGGICQRLLGEDASRRG